MQVTLLHNKTAGSENHAAEELEASFRQAGHEVLDTVSTHEELPALLRVRPPELIVIAGGDGTVSRASCALAGCAVPLAVLPLGTANNTALTLGAHGDMNELVRGWSSGRVVPFDLATLAGVEPSTRFSEAVGWGVFPSVIARARQLSEPDEPAHTLERDRQLFHTTIKDFRPHAYELYVDGTRVAGEFLAVEIMNIPLLGPRLALSPASDPGDGLLELVVAAPSERGALLELASSGRLGSGAPLRTLRGKHITVRTEAPAFHRDGSLVPHAPAGAEFTVAVEPASVRYLVRPGSG
jgi:diacylglycerol kinase family enzyme